MIAAAAQDGRARWLVAVSSHDEPARRILTTTATSSGWAEAIGCVACIGALSLAYAIGHARGAHPIAFILYGMLVASSALLLVTGLGADAAAIVRHPMSWVAGLSIILIEVFYFVTLMQVPPAHGNLILRIGVPIAMATGWWVFGRRPRTLGLVGAAVIVAAIAFVVALAPPGVRWPAAAAGMLAAVFMVIRGFSSEFHPWNRAARTLQEKLRITGILVLVSSLSSLLLTALAAGAIALSILPPLPFVPTAAQMLHGPTMLLGGLVGGAVIALMFYLNFSSVVKITTENLTAMMAFSPLTTWAFQELGVRLGLISAQRPGVALVAAMAVVIAAVLLIFQAQRLARRA